MKQLWGWTATDAFNRPRDYQAYGPDVTEAAMLEHLKLHFRNVTITGLKRLQDGEYKPATGEIESHTYHFGLIDAVQRERGLTPYTDLLKLQQSRPKPSPIARAPIIRSPIIRSNR